ncbi:armadillo-type protein [Blastocladiella britannica]|nr:armadillo-type protein [Blastocladiella britannica]
MPKVVRIVSWKRAMPIPGIYIIQSSIYILTTSAVVVVRTGAANGKAGDNVGCLDGDLAECCKGHAHRQSWHKKKMMAAPTQTTTPATTDVEPAVAAKTDTATALVALLQRPANVLSDPTSDRFAKLRALDTIQKQIVVPARADPTATLVPVLRVLAPVLARTLAHDPVEKARENAARMLATLVAAAPAVDSFVPQIVPALVDRLAATGAQTANASGAPLEPSEELRLELTKLLGLIVSKCESDPGFMMPEAAAILKTTVNDPYPDVRKEAFTIVALLATRTPAQFRPHAEPLLAALVSALGYRHAAIRGSALMAFGAAAMTDATSLRTHWPAVQRLTLDSVAAVRRQLYTVVANLALRLPDRYSFGDLFVRVILNGLADDVDDLQSKCMTTAREISALYEKEWEDRVKDALDYDPQARDGLLGFRALVRDNLMKMIDVMVVELADWTAPVREGAVRALVELLPFARQHVSGYLGKLIPALVKTLDDPFAGTTLRAAEAIGSAIAPDLLLNLILPNVRNGPYLTFLAAAIKNAPLEPAHWELLVTELADALESDPALPGLPAAVDLFTRASAACEEGAATAALSRALLMAGLHAAASHPSSVSIIQSPACIAVIPAVLNELATTRSVVHHAPGSATARLLLTQAPASAVLVPALARVLERMDEEAVIVMAPIVLARIKEAQLQASATTLDEFAEAAWVWLMGAISWRAGRVAIAVRAALLPIAAVLVPLAIPDRLPRLPAIRESIVTGPMTDSGTQQAFARPPTGALADVLVNVANAMDDDNVGTRTSGAEIIKYLISVGAAVGWSPEHVKAVYPELIKRLDDAADNVRVLSATCLALVYDHLECAQTTEGPNVMDSVHHVAILQAVAIHVDDPMIAVRSAALEVIRAMYRKHPDVVREYIETSTSTFRYRAAFDEFQ